MFKTILAAVLLAASASAAELDEPMTRTQAWSFMEHGYTLAKVYAKEMGSKLRVREMPKLIMCDASTINEACGIPYIDSRHRLWGATSYTWKTVWLDERADAAVILHECYHWFFDDDCDEADRFARWGLSHRDKHENGLRRMLNGNDK